MLASNYRLKDRRRINLIYRKGKKIVGHRIILRTYPNQKKETKIAFIVGKKTFKKATQRNKIKRILKAILQEKIKKITQKQDIVIEYKQAKKEDHKKFLSQSFQEIKIILEKEIDFLFKKNNFYS